MPGDKGFDETAAYYARIISEDDVQPLKRLLKYIHIARAGPVREYLQRHCRNIQDLEYFFVEENSHLFYVENGRVALFNDQELMRAEAIEYFKGVLEQYDEPVDYMTLRTDHLNDATDSIQNFIIRFYPGKEFKNFLRSKPDVFVVHQNERAFLIEVESVAYYKKRLGEFGRPGLHFMNFRGHIGCASPEIQRYINRYYLGDEFQDFLRRHPDVFVLDEEGCVSLAPLS